MKLKLPYLLAFVVGGLLLLPIHAKAQCNIQAAYTFKTDSANCKKIVFTNTSSGANNTTYYSWSFGDSTTSGDKNPSHTFSSNGTYYVCLYVKKVDGSNVCYDTICDHVTINCSNCSVTAYFTYALDSADCKKMHFTNQTAGANTSTSYSWSFGDASNSGDKNPTHGYTNNGTYNVCLKAVKVDGSQTCKDSICKSITINCNNCKVEANFAWKRDSANCKKMYFSNTTGGTNNTTYCHWRFGDGGTSQSTNPDHTYNDSGYYTVCLVVEKTDGSQTCRDSICKTVHVECGTPACNLQAYFAFKQDSANCKKIIFTNYTTPTNNTTYYSWHFDDGGSSLDKNPTHTYNDTGRYTVCLAVKYVDGSRTCYDTICKTIHVECGSTNPCSLKPDFTWKRDSANCKKMLFTNTSTPINNTTYFTWRFGDGGTSGDKTPSHTYNDSGWRTVCLVMKWVDGNRTCYDSICKYVHVECHPVCNVKAAFKFEKDSANCKKIYFVNLSSNTVTGTQYVWTFGDGATSTDKNILHTYSNPGTYRVCLRAGQIVNGHLCIDSVCTEIRVCDSCNLHGEFKYTPDSSDCKKIKFQALVTGPASIKWYFGDGSTGTGFDPTHTYNHGDHYNVCIVVVKTVNNKVCRDSSCYRIPVCVTTSTGGTQSLSGLNVYPNPFDNEIFVQIPVSGTQTYNISITDILGKTLVENNYTLNEGSGMVSLSTGQLSKGIYFINISDAKGATYRQRIVK